MQERVIRFRAWDREGKEMFRVVMISFMSKGEIILSGRGGTTDNKNAILMQYTGLKDKNGKEIYEGDIVKQIWFKPKTDVIGIVEFFEGEFFGHTKIFIASEGNRAGKMELTESDTEVIGNIYENSNLIK